MAKKNRPYAWMKNIFCCFEDDRLKQAVEQWADENGCTLTWAKESLDIITTPYFVAIVDRGVLGEKPWQVYLEFVKDVTKEVEFDSELLKIEGVADSGKIEPIIVIDTREGLVETDNDYFYYRDANDLESILKIITDSRK